MSSQTSGSAHVAMPSESLETAPPFMPDQAAVDASALMLCSSVWNQKPAMLDEVARDARAFPPSQAIGNANVSNADQSNEDPSVFIPTRPWEDPPASTSDKQFGDPPTTLAKQNGNTSASTPYQLTGNAQNIPDMAYMISITGHASQSGQAFMISLPHSTKYSNYNPANKPIQRQIKGHPRFGPSENIAK